MIFALLAALLVIVLFRAIVGMLAASCCIIFWLAVAMLSPAGMVLVISAGLLWAVIG